MGKIGGARLAGGFGIVLMSFFAPLNAVCATLASPEVEDFRLSDQFGAPHELYGYSNSARAIVLISQGNGCPITRQSIPKIKALRDEFSKQGVVILLINADSQDSRGDILKEAKDFAIDLPILVDESQTIAESLGIVRTAEALLIDPVHWRIVYRGPIDDELGYGTRKPRARKHYLAEALRALLEHKPVAVASVQASGCAIYFQRDPAAGYVRDIAPLLSRRCLACHQDASKAPPLSTYEQVRRAGKGIRKVVRTRHAGSLPQEISMTAQEARQLTHWLESGAPLETAGE